MKFRHHLQLLFLPHEKNNHRALILQPGFLGVLIAVYILSQSFIRSFTVVKPGVLGYSSEITAEKVFTKTNVERTKKNLPLLTYNATLSQSAKLKAEDMFAKDYWAHYSPDGQSPWDFFKAAGYDYSIAGENLAKDFYDTDTMMKAWMNSPTHKANIMSDKYSEIGIAVVNGILNGVETTLVVQHFGHPLAVVITSPTADEKAFTARAAAVAQAPASSQVLSSSHSFEVSPLTLSKTFGLVMFLVIVTVLILDVYFTFKNGAHRLTGSSLGHVSFLLIILMLLIFTRQGTIF